MISIKPTENLTGITICGDYTDFKELVDSIHRMTATEYDPTDLYFGVKMRLLGMCYDIRHAFMGDRDIIFKDNGMNSDKMKWHSLITPTQNVYYSVNILFPEAIFVAASAYRIYLSSRLLYGANGRVGAEDIYSPSFLYSDYIRDKANLNVLYAGFGRHWEK